MSAALKEKLGRAEVVLLWAGVLPGGAPGTPRCIDCGRRREKDPVCVSEGPGVLGCIGKEKVGLGIISKVGSVRVALAEIGFEMLLVCLWWRARPGSATSAMVTAGSPGAVTEGYCIVVGLSFTSRLGGQVTLGRPAEAMVVGFEKSAGSKFGRR